METTIENLTDKVLRLLVVLDRNTEELEGKIEQIAEELKELKKEFKKNEELKLSLIHI